MNLDEMKIAIVGLGYVGLPLAVEFGKKRPVVGFDIRAERIVELERGYDDTLEIELDDLQTARQLSFTSNADDLKSCSIFIVTVPTPIDDAKRPDLKPLKMASETVGNIMPEGAMVIYESTVYPGCTKEVCVPILEAKSGLKLNDSFFVGYSPERINPGDKNHRLPSIIKVTSGSTPEAADAIDALYLSIITAGTHKATSIEVAEAAKVIENTQRDLNIALVNELALIFHRLGIDTLDVLEAAGTKWNFLPFRPGLVGGHCIGIDPYYLTHKAQALGYYPEVVLAGRRINDSMGTYIANRLIREMIQRDIAVKGARVLLMGLTFKENCPDLRNTRVVDVIYELETFGVEVDVHDPWADPSEAIKEYGITLTSPQHGAYDAIVVAVGHSSFLAGGIGVVRSFGKPLHVLFDVKGMFPRAEVEIRL